MLLSPEGKQHCSLAPPPRHTETMSIDELGRITSTHLSDIRFEGVDIEVGPAPAIAGTLLDHSLD